MKKETITKVSFLIKWNTTFNLEVNYMAYSENNLFAMSFFNELRKLLDYTAYEMENA